jgi:hypothetical protein
MWQKYCREGQTTDENLAREYCWILKPTYLQTGYLNFVFPLQQWLHERASMLLISRLLVLSLLFEILTLKHRIMDAVQTANNYRRYIAVRILQN